MKTLKNHEGYRLSTGYHAGYALLRYNGKYYISQESGTRLATKKEIKEYKELKK